MIDKLDLRKVKQTPRLDFYTADTSSTEPLPFYASPVEAGFPSPADDYIELELDLNKKLIQHPEATFYARVKGSSMEEAGICDGDILIVDRAVPPQDGKIAVCVIEGEFTVKRIKKQGDNLYLLPENDEFEPIKITQANDFEVWGVVQYVIHKT